MTPCKGHLLFAPGSNGVNEYYTDGRDVYRAPLSSCIDCLTGYRIGRWECTLAAWPMCQQAMHLRGEEAQS
jgi:hypothetical protein